jgi:RNase P subunit RPR2
MIDARVWHDEVDSTVKLVVEICCNCAVPFAMPQTLRKRALADHSVSFYCPHGHSQHFVGKTEAELLADKLALARRRAEMAEEAARSERLSRKTIERQAAAYKGQATRLRKRIGNGTCPACHRHFANVERHMDSKHPGYADAPVTPGG